MKQRRINTLSTIAIAAMVLLSFTSLTGLGIAGISVFVGIAAFFIDKSVRKQAFAGSGLDSKGLGKALRVRGIWLWILLPTLVNVILHFASRQFFPAFAEHVMARIGGVLTLGSLAPLAAQLALSAIGEEIAWRAFFQNQLEKVMPPAASILASSALFGLCHYASGDFWVVAIDVFFVFANSCLYGIVFRKTHNAWASAISHFCANLVALVLLLW